MIKRNKKLILKIIIFIIFLAAGTLLTIWAFPKAMELTDPNVRAHYKEQIDSMGISGWFVMLGVQVLQVVFAIIPGEPIEVLCGLLFGGIEGMIVCLAGIFIGTVIIYYVIKLLGKPFVELFISKEKIDSLSFLHDDKRLEQIVFILFFIPGTPKDLLTYIIPLTDINPGRFFLIATFARIPSIITSTFAGAAIYDGNILSTVILFVVAAVLALAGILVNKKLMKFLQKRRNKKK